MLSRNSLLLLALSDLLADETNHLSAHLFDRHLDNGDGRKQGAVDRTAVETGKLEMGGDVEIAVTGIAHQAIHEQVGGEEEGIYTGTDGEYAIEYLRKFFLVVLDRELSIQLLVEGDASLCQGIAIALNTLPDGILQGIDAQESNTASSALYHAGHNLSRALTVGRHDGASLPLWLQLVERHCGEIGGKIGIRTAIGAMKRRYEEPVHPLLLKEVYQAILAPIVAVGTAHHKRITLRFCLTLDTICQLGEERVGDIGYYESQILGITGIQTTGKYIGLIVEFLRTSENSLLRLLIDLPCITLP